jgi:biotin synthase-like enzyme
LITFEKLKEMNESGELPKHFTDEELQDIITAESMVCHGGCAFCPMAQFEYGPNPININLKKTENIKKEDSSNNTEDPK